MRIDHVLIGARDLPAAADRLRDEHGLASVDGGVHPEWGTGNRIFPLGDDYVELIGIVDEETAARSLLGSWLREQLADGD
ncbi:MAG TPA: VOC family protein, partial [Solirubrobacteraceae bacterium]